MIYCLNSRRSNQKTIRRIFYTSRLDWKPTLSKCANTHTSICTMLATYKFTGAPQRLQNRPTHSLRLARSPALYRNRSAYLSLFST